MQRSMRRSTPHRTTILRGGALAALVLVGAGCAGTGGGTLLVAEGTPTSADGVKIWSAAPGDELDDGRLVVASAQRPGSVSTRLEDGTTWINGLGRTWKGSDLLAYADASSTNLISTSPGGEPEQLASATDLQTTVLRRGAYVRTADGCLLATSPTETEQLGTGSCAISSDERWVVSWGSPGEDAPALTIRDLRHDHDETVDLDGRVVNAVVLAAGESPDGYRGVVLDATDGSEVGRTDAFSYLDVATVGAEATGFVIITTNSAASDPTAPEAPTTALSYVDADARVESIDSGYYLVPVQTGETITYLSYGNELSASSVREWSPGDDEPHVLLEGQVGAGTADGRLLVLREVAASGDDPAGVEFWRPDASHELVKVLTVPAPEGTMGIEEGGSGATVSRAWVRGAMVYLQLDQAPASSFVRIDMAGDHSDVPIENAERLLLESLDVDGTALLTRGDEAAGDEAILVVRPHDHDAEERARFTSTGLNLIHEGVIYVTSISGSSDAPEVAVHSVRATGKERRELLWSDRQIAGATWPEQNGATVTAITTVGSLIAQQQAAQQQQGVQDVTGTVPTDGAG
ncbi:MAG: hypothetical protein ACYC2O_05130 [Microthrixaceae bacterium]